MKRGTVKKLLALMLSIGTIAGGFSWQGTNIWAAENEADMQPVEGGNEGINENQGNSSEYQDTSELSQNGMTAQQSDQILPENLGVDGQNAEEIPEAGSYSLTEDQMIQEPVEGQVEASSEENGETTPETEGEDVVANSWRFKDGVPIPQITSRAAAYPYAWEMVDGHYVNNRGDVIPGAIKKGIDVSFWNGTINWEKVKADGIDFAIIRCGYGMNFTDQDDKQWVRNVSECERLGIPYGVYLYSYANSTVNASSEADHVLRLLQGHNPTYPVYYDLEDDEVLAVSASMKGQIAKIFCDKIEAAGYKVGIYSNTTWFNNYLTDPVFSNPNWSKWVAQWNVQCEYQGKYDIWQCAADGSVDGISGNVDLNFLMDGASFGTGDQETPEKPTPEVQNRVMQYDSSSGNWYVYINGKRDTTYTGVVQNENGWWYAKNGILDWSYTGVAQNENGWWYINHGALDWTYTGVAQNENGWWYINDGWLNWDYTGVGENESGWWYINNGWLNWNYNGKVTYKGRTYSVVGGYVIH